MQVLVEWDVDEQSVGGEYDREAPQPGSGQPVIPDQRQTLAPDLHPAHQAAGRVGHRAHQPVYLSAHQQSSGQDDQSQSERPPEERFGSSASKPTRLHPDQNRQPAGCQQAQHRPAAGGEQQPHQNDEGQAAGEKNQSLSPSLAMRSTPEPRRTGPPTPASRPVTLAEITRPGGAGSAALIAAPTRLTRLNFPGSELNEWLSGQ